MPNAQEVLEWMEWKEREKKLTANMTNEEWFSTLSTEEKAKFFVMIEMTAMHPIKRGAVDMEKFIEEVVEWLKQPHNSPK